MKKHLIAIGCIIVLALPLAGETAPAVCSQLGTWKVPTALPCVAAVNFDSEAVTGAHDALDDFAIPRETDSAGQDAENDLNGLSPQTANIEIFSSELRFQSAHTPRKLEAELPPPSLSYLGQQWSLPSAIDSPDAPSYVKLLAPSSSRAAGGPLTSYHPLTGGEKFGYFIQHANSPAMMFAASVDATLARVMGENRGYGGGLAGYSKLYASALADNESGAFFGQYLLPVIYRQDPRYFRLKEGSIKKRALYAVSRVFITRNDKGHEVFNSSHLLARFMSKSLSNIYYAPEQRTLGHTLHRTARSLFTDSYMYLEKEFWPDLREKILPRRFKHKK